MRIEYFQELISIGLKPIPINWDADTRVATSHNVSHSEITQDNWDAVSLDKWLPKIEAANGIALKLFPPFGMIDFDTKNCDNKNLFSDWFNIIEATHPEVLRKVCIETTRNGGHHLYIKHSKLNHKIPVACSQTGAETISVYTGGLLSYCSPTPGYDMFHNSFDDLQELTDDEFDLLVSTSALFNQYEPKHEQGEQGFAPIQYPKEYESTCLQFDNGISDEAFDILLNSITLYRSPMKVRKTKYQYTPYLRKGSEANYSAKVFFDSKRLLLFTTSIPNFPSWADRKTNNDKSWVLSPSRIIYYKNNRDWIAAIEEINTICDSIGLIIEQPKPLSDSRIDRTSFPYDIFPVPIQQYIQSTTIQKEYVAGFMLGALATAIGNTCYLYARDGYNVKPIIYLAVVAPAGGSKSPAMRMAFNYLRNEDNNSYITHKSRLAAYNEELSEYEKDKKKKDRPHKPHLQQILFDDATIEMAINILENNPKGCCLLNDELLGFIKRMGQYKNGGGDEVQKWLSMWDGSDVLLQRISKDEVKINNYTCNVIGGIQPGVLDQLSKGENQYNGFYHRFLFVYPEALPKASFSNIEVSEQLKQQVKDVFDSVMLHRDNDVKDCYRLSKEAFQLYYQWFDVKNGYYDRATDDTIKGIIAKYQGYCLRFALILQALEDGRNRSYIVSQSVMDRAIRLTEYFFANMYKALKLMQPENPIDKLRTPYDKIYSELPVMFSIKTGITIAAKYKVKESTFKDWVQRSSNLFGKVERGSYEKLL